MNSDRMEIHKIGLMRTMRALESRGYDVRSAESSTLPELQVKSPQGEVFWVNCRNVVEKGYTWFISRLDDEYRPFFILSYAPLRQDKDPAEFWILTHDEAEEFIDSFAGKQPQGNHQRFKEHHEKWEKLPR